MGVSTTHRINLSMRILIYSFSDTYYVWAACASIDKHSLREVEGEIYVFECLLNLHSDLYEEKVSKYIVQI